jgi:hypothetical protein
MTKEDLLVWASDAIFMLDKIGEDNEAATVLSACLCTGFNALLDNRVRELAKYMNTWEEAEALRCLSNPKTSSRVLN